jgi:acetamidase/formamidase
MYCCVLAEANTQQITRDDLLGCASEGNVRLADWHGCSEPDRRWFRVRDEIAEQAAQGRTGDRLQHRDEIDQSRLDSFLTARGHTRRDVLRFGSLLPLATVASPLLGGADSSRAWPLFTPRSAAPALFDPNPQGRTHTVPSVLGRSVHIGYYDNTLPPVATLDSGDVVYYPDTWSGYGNRVQPGLTMADLMAWRTEVAPWGPHSVTGPVAVRGAEPGDVLEIRILRMQPIDVGFNFNMPGSFGAGSLPEDFPEGAIKQFQLDDPSGTTEFLPGVRIPLAPFPGILGVQPEGEGRRSSVPPGPYGGNMDLRELVEGTRLFLPVFHAGGPIYITDFHAAQGDGEVNLTAIETAARDARLQVFVHKNAQLEWPFVDTPTHWITTAMSRDLNECFETCLRNMIAFMVENIGLTPHEGYALSSVAASFRVTQTVDINKGVHGMLAKDLFAPELRERIPPLVSRG